MLAANRFIYTQQVVAMRLLQYQAVRDNCRVRPDKEREIQWSLVSLSTRA